MRVRTTALAAVALALAAAGLDCRSSQPAFRPSFASSECPADVETFILAPHSCGYLTVLEDRERPAGGRIRLFAVRVRPRGGAAYREPIATVGSEIGQAPHYGDMVGLAQSSSREVIVLDQRGTGHSKPSLGCQEADDAASAARAEPLSSGSVRSTLEDAVTKCRNRLTAAGLHLHAYTPAAVADDLADLRSALRVPSWNLISWGTASRALLEYARRHPRGLRALVLDSPQFPGDLPIPQSQAGLTDALDALMRTCRASKTCDPRYRGLRHALWDAARALDRSPVVSSVRGQAIAVDGAALVRVIRDLLSDAGVQGYGRVPRIIDRAVHRNVRAVASRLARDRGLCIAYLPRCGSGWSLGAYLSFTCPSMPAFGARDPYVSACRAWHLNPVRTRRAAITTKAPALVLRGDYDASTPLEPVRDSDAVLPNARAVMVPHTGHDVLGHVNCLREARSAWLVHPESDQDVSTCLRTIPAPTFGRPSR